MLRFTAAAAVLVTSCVLIGQRSPEAQSRRRGPTPVPSPALMEARARGSVRVIVRLGVPVSPETLPGAAHAAARRAAIASTQLTVLRQLGRANAQSVRRFAYIPYMALQVDEADLQALATLPEITRIQLDTLAAPTLAQSTAIVGATTAWAGGYTGAGHAVAVLDSGVDKTHPFLAGKVVSEACYSTTDPWGGAASACPGGVQSSTAPGSGMPCSFADCWHGTHVAGIAAGRGASFSGVARDASIIAIQIFSSFATGCAPEEAVPCIRTFASDQIAGLERVLALKDTYPIAAVNMSIGAGPFTPPCDDAPQKAIIDELRAAGIATVISSGNDGHAAALSSPACISTAISVGSTTDYPDGEILADAVSRFTNSSSLLTLLAPGEFIDSSYPGGGFATVQGTSMAAPHVAGAWAVLKERRPSASVTEIADVLIATGVGVLDHRNGLTKPRIDVGAAVQALPPPPPACTYSVTPASLALPRTGGTSTLTVNTGPGCAWSASSEVPFITIVSGHSGAGPGAVVLSVAPSAVGARSGGVVVAGTTVVVAQPGVAADLNGDGYADLLWQRSSDGALATWYLSGSSVLETRSLSIDRVADVGWRVAGAGDLNGDGFTDLVWQHELTGELAAWYLSGTQVTKTLWLSISRVADTDWRIRGVADTNGDGFADLVWQHRTAGWLAVWFMNGAQVVGTHYLSTDRMSDPAWQIAGAGDTDGDGKAEIVWQHQEEGSLAVWYLDGQRVTGTAGLSVDRVADPAWKIRGVGDASGDGLADLLWQNESTGALGVWFLNGATVTSQSRLSRGVPAGTPWRIVGPG